VSEGSRMLESLSGKDRFDGNLVFGARKFHAETNRSGSGKPADGGLVREHALIVEDTGIERFVRKGDFWESVDECPVCSSHDSQFFLTRQGLDIYRCSSCGHRFQNPRISYEKACSLYADDKTASDIYTQPIQREIDRVKYKYGLDLIDSLGDGKKTKLMDIGCGAGVFLEVAAAEGWDKCVGIDANSRYQDCYSSGKGIQYINSTFESFNSTQLGSDYDCISLWNVLEHLYDLQSIVSQIKSLLRRDGLLFIMVPNVESLATRIIREKSATFNWKHVSHFSAYSLKVLMQNGGLQCVHMETAITEIDNVKSYLSGEYPYHGYGDPDSLFPFITPEYIHDNMLGSRLIGVFRNA